MLLLYTTFPVFLILTGRRLQQLLLLEAAVDEVEKRVSVSGHVNCPILCLINPGGATRQDLACILDLTSDSVKILTGLLLDII